MPQDRAALPPREEQDATTKRGIETSRKSHLFLTRGLMPFVWPADRPDLRKRVVIAAVLLVLAKLVTVMVPVFYKYATDALTENASGTSVITATNVAYGATALIIAYGVGYSVYHSLCVLDILPIIDYVCWI